MAAPTGIIWGDIAGPELRGRIGIYTSLTTTDTSVTANIEVWIWTKYSAYDSGNKLYFDIGPSITSATTNKGAISFNHTVNSSWSTSNQTKIYSVSNTYARSTTEVTQKVYAKLSGIDWVDATMYANTDIDIPALPSYTISYDANGGIGEPASQTKYYNQYLTLSSTPPTREGYTFLGWLSPVRETMYSPGETYGWNTSTTMVAQWQEITYTISYDANGGKNAPTAQTKTHGVALTLSSDIPTRSNYKFLGWAISASAVTPMYTAGQSYTANMSVTLYAVWELAYSVPALTNISVDRCLEDGTLDDYGTYARVRFSWSCDQNLGTNNATYGFIAYEGPNGTVPYPLSFSGISGDVDAIIGSGGLSIDKTYLISFVVFDSLNGQGADSRTIGTATFPIDVLAKGLGVSIGAPATKVNTFDVHWTSDMNNNKITNLGAPVNNSDAATKEYVDNSTWNGDMAGNKITNLGTPSADTDAANKEYVDQGRVTGLASYAGSGDDAIDPNTTTEFLILSDKHTPIGEGKFMFFMTFFYNTKSSTSNRAQIAIPYNYLGSVYHRFYAQGLGGWTPWRRHKNADET